jgi:hypothetical protein
MVALSPDGRWILCTQIDQAGSESDAGGELPVERNARVAIRQRSTSNYDFLKV